MALGNVRFTAEADTSTLNKAIEEAKSTVQELTSRIADIRIFTVTSVVAARTKAVWTRQLL